MNVRIVAVATIVTAAVGGQAAAQTSDEKVRELLSAVRSQAGVVAPAPAEAMVDLRLDEVVALALEKNLDIAVERLNPQTFDLSIAALRAQYRPTLTSTLNRIDTVQIPSNQLVGGQGVEQEQGNYNVGVAQAIPWYGGNVTVGWNNRRQENSNTFNQTYNPQYNSTLSATLTQPLLRNLRTDSTRTQLLVTQINRDISDIEVRTTITNTLATVRSAYWDLVYAIQAMDVARRSLDLAEKLVEDNKVRVEIGTLAPIDVVQAEAEAATRRQDLAQSEATWRTSELALKQLIVSGTSDGMWSARLNPVDRPTAQAEPIDLEAALRTALDKRTDLATSRKTLESNEFSLRLLRNQMMPAADFVATYGLQGIGGTQLIRDPTIIGSPVTGTIPGGFGDALSVLGNRQYPNWTLQVNISYPLGGSAASANYARGRITRQQNEAQIRALELRVATEVTNAATLVESNLKRVDAARAARELAAKRLEAEQSKFEVGLSTNFFVVQAQRDLADAEISELRALLDYRKSLVDFERAQETSLSGAGISVVTTGSGSGSGGTSGSGSTNR